MTDKKPADTPTNQDRQDDTLVNDSAPDSVDEASDESFPASDPPANTPITGVGCPCHSE